MPRKNNADCSLAEYGRPIGGNIPLYATVFVLSENTEYITNSRLSLTRHEDENIVCFIRLSKNISIESKIFALPNNGFFMGLSENAIGTSSDQLTAHTQLNY
jgi:hypothetical protein